MILTSNPISGQSISYRTHVFVYGTFETLPSATLNAIDVSSYIKEVGTGFYLFFYTSSLGAGLEYTLIIDNQEIRFSTKKETNYINNQEEYNYSSFTQLLANAYPLASDARFNQYSTFQQLLNPLANDLEDLSRQTTNIVESYIPLEADTSTLDIINYIDVPNTYTFKKIRSGASREVYISPIVFGLEGTEKLPITLSPENNLEKLNLVVPNRISLEKKDKETNLLFYSQFTSVPLDLDLSFSTPQSLGINITSGSNFIYKDYLQRQKFFSLVIEGYDFNFKPLKERILIVRNGFYETKNRFTKVIKITSSNLSQENVGYVGLYLYKPVFSRLQEREYFVRNIVSDVLKSTIWEHTTNGYGSVLLQKVFPDDSLEEVNLDTVGAFELLDENNISVSAIDFATDIYSPYLYVVDAENLYIYHKNENYNFLAKYLDKSAEPSHSVFIEDPTLYRELETSGKVFTLTPYTISGKDFKSYTLKIFSDSSNFEYVQRDGSLSGDFYTFTSLEQLDIILDTCGFYLLEIETILEDNSISIDKKLLSVPFKKPLARFNLTELRDVH